MRGRIEALRSELDGKESDRREARDALRAVDVAISDANRALRDQESQAREARGEIAKLGARRSEQERALREGQAVLARLLAARGTPASAGGAPDFLRVALAGEDLGDAARRLQYLSYVSRAVAQRLAEHRAGVAALTRLRADGEAQARELASIEANARVERDRLLAQRRERRRLLDRLAGEIRQAQRGLQALRGDETRLSRLVEEIGKVLTARPGAGYRRVEKIPEAGGTRIAFSSLKGRLRLPVRGELAGRFGARSVPGGAASKGIFIRAAEGEPVRAVAPGRVVFADWMRGFGNLLVLDHGENFLTIYGNNESLLKHAGDAVASGEPLATVGASGGREETGLYFELRHQGKPFDPLRWARLK